MVLATLRYNTSLIWLVTYDIVNNMLADKIITNWNFAKIRLVSN